jgi:hypothetical protein
VCALCCVAAKAAPALRHTRPAPAGDTHATPTLFHPPRSRPRRLTHAACTQARRPTYPVCRGRAARALGLFPSPLRRPSQSMRRGRRMRSARGRATGPHTPSAPRHRTQDARNSPAAHNDGQCAPSQAHTTAPHPLTNQHNTPCRRRAAAATAGRARPTRWSPSAAGPARGRARSAGPGAGPVTAWEWGESGEGGVQERAGRGGEAACPRKKDARRREEKRRRNAHAWPASAPALGKWTAPASPRPGQTGRVHRRRHHRGGRRSRRAGPPSRVSSPFNGERVRGVFFFFVVSAPLLSPLHPSVLRKKRTEKLW